jgi:hypothetical protein
MQMGENSKVATAGDQKWVAEYRSWQCSGLKQREYCEEAGLKFWQFKAGIESARQRGVLTRQNGKYRPVPEVSRSTGFAAVQINAASSDPEIPYCEIKFGGKMGIQISSAESLREFFDLINSCVQR